MGSADSLNDKHLGKEWLWGNDMQPKTLNVSFDAVARKKRAVRPLKP